MHTLHRQRRLTASRKLDYVKLAQALESTQHLNHEFEQIPENRVRLLESGDCVPAAFFFLALMFNSDCCSRRQRPCRA